MRGLIRYDTAMMVGLLPARWYGPRLPPCLVARWDTCHFELHNKRRGARRVRRLLRRHARLNRRIADFHGFTYAEQGGEERWDCVKCSCNSRC